MFSLRVSIGNVIANGVNFIMSEGHAGFLDSDRGWAARVDFSLGFQLLAYG
jgi:hypothetical protein